MIISGHCHCGNVEYDLETSRSWDEITLRVCRCEFCLRHRPRYWSDPQGAITVHVKDPRDIHLYRFGHGTADFVVCRGCGVFCFAVAESAAGHIVVANLNLALTRDDAPSETFLEALQEDQPERDTRRARNWTPLASPWPPRPPVAGG